MTVVVVMELATGINPMKKKLDWRLVTITSVLLFWSGNTFVEPDSENLPPQSLVISSVHSLPVKTIEIIFGF